MRVAAAASTIQRSYEAGEISYPRTSARTLGAAGVSHVAGLGVALPPMVFESFPQATRRPHEAVHVLTDALPGFSGVPQHLLPESMRFLDRVARATVRAAVPLQIERPDVSALPQWARDLPWWRPGPDFIPQARSAADGADRVARAELFDFDAEEVAFETLVREGLGRPSSVAEHALRAAERGFVDARGLTTLGENALVGVPPSLTVPGIAHAVEAVIEADDAAGAAEGPPGDLVELCFGVMPELAPRLRAALRKGEGDGGSEMKPASAAVVDQSDSDASEAARAYWERRSTPRAATEADPCELADPLDTAVLDAATRQRAVRHSTATDAAASSTDDSDAISREGSETCAALTAVAVGPDELTWPIDRVPLGAVGVGEDDGLELDDDDRTSYAAGGPKPW